MPDQTQKPSVTKDKGAVDDRVAVVKKFDDNTALIRKGDSYRIIGEMEHFGYSTSPRDPLPTNFIMPSEAFNKLLKPHDWTKGLQLPATAAIAANVEFWRRGCVSGDTKPSSEIIAHAARHLARYLHDSLT